MVLSGEITKSPDKSMNVREDTFTVKTYQCQPDGSIRVASLMHYLQEVAAVHAEQLGFGLDRLNETESYWVLSNLEIQFAKFPKWNDQVTIRTWPSGHTRSVATREFVGKDEYDCELFRAGSEWMVLNKRSSRLRNLFRLGLNLPQTGPKAISANLKRMAPQDSYSQTERVRVPYSSIDLNGHVNNTEYVRWSIDALRRAFEFKGPVRCIQATYFSEVFEGDELDLLLSSAPTGRFCVLGRKPDDQSNVFAAQIFC